MRAEMLISIHRLEMRHIPTILAPLGWSSTVEAPGVFKGMRHGLPVLNALDMLPMCAAPGDPLLCTIIKGRVVTRDLFWWARVALRRIELNHLANLSAMGDIRRIEQLHISLVAFATRLRDWKEAPPCQMRAPPKKRVGRLSLRDGTTIIPLTTFETFKKVMPGCMRELSDRAFLPHVQPHLIYNERSILYEFYLANGMDPRTFADAIVAKFEGTDHNTRELVQAVKSTDGYVQGSKFELGRGCNRLQREGFCPFYYPPSASAPPISLNEEEAKKRRARGDCHVNLLALAGKREDPDGVGQRSNFPLIAAQKVARWMQPESPPQPPACT
jgi:hypothetical protein